MPSSQLDRRELRMPSLPYRRRNLVVLSDEHNKTTLATGCVAFLVFVAFLAAYAGQSLQPETGPANNWGLSDKIAVIAAVVESANSSPCSVRPTLCVHRRNDSCGPTFTSPIHSA